MPTPIRTLFEKSIDRHIEGVIKADDDSDLLTIFHPMFGE